MNDQLLYQIALLKIPEVGLQHAKALIRYYGSASEFFRASGEAMHQIPNIGFAYAEMIAKGRDKALQAAERELKFIEQHKIRAYYYEDADYPQRLAQCPDAPLLLYTKGNMQLNEGQFVSIVGTRRCTERGRQLTHDLVRDLSQKVDNLTIISGLAYGIDVAAHRAALEMDIPTLMVVAHGLDRIYPAEHRREAVAALKQGGIITEYTSGTKPDAPNFLQRNRIVAGLADAVIVVESKEKGGSLNTAATAFSYNRDVFAFPGRPTDENARGCNQLIKSQKAAMIEGADDLIEAMMWEAQKKAAEQPAQTSLFVELTSDEQKLLSLIQTEEDGKHINLIVAESGMPYSQVVAKLMQMEMKHIVKQLPGSIFRAL